MIERARPFPRLDLIKPIAWSTSPNRRTPEAIKPAVVVKGERPTTLIQPSAVHPSVEATT